jgi:hypothetical protein
MPDILTESEIRSIIKEELKEHGLSLNEQVAFSIEKAMFEISQANTEQSKKIVKEDTSKFFKDATGYDIEDISEVRGIFDTWRKTQKYANWFLMGLFTAAGLSIWSAFNFFKK